MTRKASRPAEESAFLVQEISDSFVHPEKYDKPHKPRLGPLSDAQAFDELERKFEKVSIAYKYREEDPESVPNDVRFDAYLGIYIEIDRPLRL